MFKNLKMTIATRRVQNKNRRKTIKKTAPKTFWGRVAYVIAWPFRMIGRACKKIWSWIRSIDLIGLVNSTLLIAIICLFSMLIIDVLNCRNNMATKPSVQQTTVHAARTEQKITVNNVNVTLPMQNNAKPVNVAHVHPDRVAIRQTARTGKTLFGDVVIDSRGAATVLQNGTHVRGNLYLQHMRKYTLPCGVRIDGNLFLRDMGMLQFCGDFTVTGNIYVTPNSSFGPIPRTARLGGQVIL